MDAANRIRPQSLPRAFRALLPGAVSLET